MAVVREASLVDWLLQPQPLDEILHEIQGLVALQLNQLGLDP